MSDRELRRVLLVGFMGAGKTSVGRRLAEGLGWRFVDFDDVVESRAGATVRQIFAERGEESFRALEDRVARDLLGRNHLVLGSGGGWAAVPGRLAALPPGTVSIWLRVPPAEALERTAAEPGRRPLLEVEDPLGEATRLLARRTACYAAADWVVDTSGRTVEDVSAQILQMLARMTPERD